MVAHQGKTRAIPRVSETAKAPITLRQLDWLVRNVDAAFVPLPECEFDTSDGLCMR